MRRFGPSYIFLKAVMYFLLLAMTLVFSAPLCFLLHQNGMGDYDANRITALVSFFFLLLIDWFFLKNADLSRISAGKYLLGECSAFALVTAAGALVTFAVSGGVQPIGFSYGTFIFLPVSGFAYLFGNLFLGAGAQIVSFCLLFSLLYLLKKKKDPSLQGVKKTPFAAPEPEQAREREEQEQEEEQNDRN